jgi:AcrR family transcriptional regulator
MMNEQPPQTRPYKSTLRETQAQQTRELILDALVHLLDDRQADEVSTRQLAEQAGVSLRTVYRHFPDRDALLNGVADRLATVMGTRILEASLETVDDLGPMVETMYAANDDFATLVRAEVLFNSDPTRQAQESRNRTDTTLNLVKATFPELDARDQFHLAALIRTLLAGRNWLQMREGFGLKGTQSGPLVAWALDALLIEVRRGNLPQIPMAEPEA